MKSVAEKINDAAQIQDQYIGYQSNLNIDNNQNYQQEEDDIDNIDFDQIQKEIMNKVQNSPNKYNNQENNDEISNINDDQLQYNNQFQSSLQIVQEQSNSDYNQQIIQNQSQISQRQQQKSDQTMKNQLNITKNIQSSNSAFHVIKRQIIQKQINIQGENNENISETLKRFIIYEEQDQQKLKQNKNEPNLLKKMSVNLLTTLQQCNSKFCYKPQFMNPKRYLTWPHEGMLNNGYDNCESDYILKVSDEIMTPEGKNYEIQELMGKGTFGQVVKCIYHKTKEMVAIKVIKNKKAFKNQGVIEIKILDLLNRVYDPNGENPLVRMIDFFVFREHLCIVFELLSASVFDLIKENNFQGLSLNFSRLIISQILDSMKIIKEAKLIHCDLKPENILFKSKENLTLKIIDFGSACFEGYAIFQYIQSRYYRSPEVLLGLPYDSAIDMWSLGCIAAELFLGIPIFPGDSEYDQLAKIFEIVGLPPQHLIQRAKYRDKYFYFQSDIQQFRFKNFEEFKLSTGINIKIPKKYFPMKCLDDLKQIFIEKKRQIQAQKTGKRIQEINFPIIQEAEMNTMDSAIDFLKGLLRIDKDTRWTPLMAKEHPFITRQYFNGPFEPQREQERISTNDTYDDTASERSTSSKDSKDYKVGSCPSKILYPQSVQMPQYLQNQQQQQQQVQINQGSEYVFHGHNQQVLSHRPPVLSIPDEYFKGFMFSSLDQILSMTKEQLYQFVYEQNELIFRQNEQRIYQQMLQQKYQQQMQQVPNPQQLNYFNQQQKQQFIPYNMTPQQQMQMQLQQMQFNQWLQQQQQLQQQMQLQMWQQAMSQQYQYQQQPYQIEQQFIQQQQQRYQQQQFPNEQQIFNPPPYMQLKQQLVINNIGDLQQQQQRAQEFRCKQKDQKGKAGSWHPPPGLQQHKYNQYYNQINNPGQIIGRPIQQQIGQQQQFIHQNQIKQKQQNIQSQKGKNQVCTKNDFKKIKEKKNPQNQSLFGPIIIEENSDINVSNVPFPSNQQIFSNDQQQIKKQIEQSQFNQQQSKFQDTFNQQLQFPITPRDQLQMVPLNDLDQQQIQIKQKQQKAQGIQQIRRQTNKSQQLQNPPQPEQQQYMGGYLKKWEQQSQDNQIFNKPHIYQYQKHIMTQQQQNRNRSNSDQQNEESKDQKALQKHLQSQSESNLFNKTDEQDQESPSFRNKQTGFAGLQEQIKKQGLNSPDKLPHSAKGQGSFKFESDENEEQKLSKKQQKQQVIRLSKAQIDSQNKNFIYTKNKMEKESQQNQQNIQILVQQKTSYKTSSQNQNQSVGIKQMTSQSSVRNLTPIDEQATLDRHMREGSDSSDGDLQK